MTQFRSRLWTLVQVAAFCILMRAISSAQAPEPSLPPSDRVTINLAAGMPGQSPWLYVKDVDSPGAVTAPDFAAENYPDSSWTSVGLPYSANLLTSFINAESGGGDGYLDGGTNWYRLHFKLDLKYAASKVLVEFEGAHTGAQVFINGTLLPGISAVGANANASHVVGFVPFIVDLTPYVKADGAYDNVIAVRVSRSGASWFEDPKFSEDYRFGQGDAGLFRPVDMFLTNKVHIPENIYSNLKTWGTYVATVSEVPSPNGTATAASAVIEVQNNVLNETSSAQSVTLTTQIVDKNGNVVAVGAPQTQTVPPMTPATFPSSATPMFSQQITVNNPTLWYPNNSTLGTPYMYKVYSIVSVNGAVVDSVQSPLGIRTITWDANFPYFNGHKMFLWGGSGRYDYPALGSSVPEEQQWRDLAQMAAAGGNIWRPGHSTSSEEFVNAADAYGIMIDQPSGDGEGAFNTPAADTVTLKEELHRDMVIRDRSHPSILDWESDNGPTNETVGAALLNYVNEWDPVNTRASADRTPDPKNGLILGCTLEGCEVGVKETTSPVNLTNNPAWGAEYWGIGTARGLAYDNEVEFAGQFLDNWTKSQKANAFGIAQWYMADTPGESSLYEEYQQDAGNVTKAKADQASVRSLGASMVDQNRFPKLLYYVYQAAWVPYQIKPVVKLAHHWNRAYQASAPIQVNAFSNCPSVRLMINGASQGTKVPNPWTSDPGTNPPQTTTQIAGQVSWTVNWVSGYVEADCLDEYGNQVASDRINTAGAPDHIVLSVVPELVKPNGTSFAVTANGSDAAFVTATVVDKAGNWVPTANNNITFSVSGPATYMGGTEQYVQTGSDNWALTGPLAKATPVNTLDYHSPGDPELQAEGGLTKIAIRSQFTTGPVTVSASSPGLGSGTTSYAIQPIPSTIPAPQPPAIIVQPVSVAVTAGQPATFSVTATGAATLTFQWSQNGSHIPNATAATYTTPATTTSENGNTFSVTVTNALGSVPSNNATLTVDTAATPVITTQPAAQAASVGQTATFTVAATGSPTLSYQWKKNGAPITGASSPSYTTPVLAAADNGSTYSVVVTNPVGSATSAAAQLTVNAAVAPAILTSPTSALVLTNNPANFSVTASGTAPLSYQWYKNNVAISGANQSTFSIPAVQASDAGSYTAVVSNVAGSATSGAATLALAPPGVNLALNLPAGNYTASSYQDPVGLAANFAFDGNLTTRWGSAFTPAAYLQVNLGSVQSFNTVVLYWDPAYATQYDIQYSTDGVTFQNATTNNSGVGGTETLQFPTVKAQYVRMNGRVRANPAYGYSVDEFQIYNVAQCGGSTERYTILPSNTQVLDNLSGLTWERASYTLPGGGSQFTQPLAVNYCAGMSMRLPTEAEALSISGIASASCAFPQPWSTWTTTVDPTNSGDDYFVSSSGSATPQVANNFPGAALCTSGTTVPPPTITAQPASQTVAAGATATFSVTASGSGTLTYQWSKNGVPIAAATASRYTTPATLASDNNSLFTVLVTGPSGGSVTSNAATLTVTGGTGGGGGGGGGTDLIAIAAGASAATGTFSADQDFNGGGANSNFNAPISIAGVTNPAPVAVYQSERAGVFSYTISGLTAGATYPIRLHFAEYYWTKPGQRVFNVSINGTPVLPNFDIVAAAGANQALVEQFPATANHSNQIVISFTAGAADQPKVSGIEVLATTGTPPTLPAAPTALTATAVSSSAINLSWTASTTTGVTYNLYRSTVSGFTPSSSTLLPASITGTTYSDTGLTASTTYYYVVEAVSSAGTSAPSNQAVQATQAGSGGGSDIVAINAGGGVVNNFVADTDVVGGSIYAPGATITVPSGLAGAAPAAVYADARQGNFTYTIPGLVSGNSYTVVLHFAELYFNAAKQREFNVSINGTPVLTNFDIFAAAGNKNYTAVVQTFPNIVAKNNQIVVAFSSGVIDQPLLNGIEIQSASGAAAIPASPHPAVTATASPAASTADARTIASITPQAAAAGPDVVAINAGGGVAGNFAADTDAAGGSIYAPTGATITVPAGLAGAAPAAVYADARQGSFTYTIPGLISGNAYTVVLHFAELYFNAAQQREFNVSINGTPVLTNFDIFQAAGGKEFTAVVQSFPNIVALGNQIVLAFSNGAKDQPMLSGIEIQGASAPPPAAVSIDSGGGAAGSFVADTSFNGGGEYAPPGVTITIPAAVTSAAPAAIYQSARQGDFSYTLSGFAAGSSNTVLLHFAELYFNAAGQRQFNVAINNKPVLTNFDIVQAAGGKAFTAVVQQFPNQIANGGQYVITFSNGAKDQPMLNGLQILGTTSAAPVITAQPSPESAALGASATFTVTAGSSGTLSYQWYRAGAAISGATAAAYTTPPTVAADNGAAFYVVVSNSTGASTQSNTVALTVTGITSGCSAAPTVPGLPAANATSASQISLSWGASTASSSCTVSYKVFRSASSPFSPSLANQIAGDQAGTAFADSGLAPSTTYYYLVQAVDSFGASASSAQAQATTAAASGGAPTIAAQPSPLTVTIGTTATFSVTAGGTGPFTYQWSKNGTAIAGASSAAYVTPAAIATDNAAQFSVVVTNAAGLSVSSANAQLTVNSSPTYTIAPGYVTTDLNNNTRGAWADNQIYVEILGCNPANNTPSWVNYNGVSTPINTADNTAPGALKAPNGQTYPNYAFTLAQASHQLLLPPISSGRIFISEGSPLYMPVTGNGTGAGCAAYGYAGPNPQNGTDPNNNIHFDFYEVTYGSGGIFIDTTQVNYFGLPLLLDVWGSVKGVTEAFHMQTGINESIAQIDQEFVAQTPAAFSTTPVTSLRIASPANSASFATGGANGTYFDPYTSAVWSYYAGNTLTLINGSREFTGRTQGSQFVLNEVNLNNGSYVGGAYTIGEPSTQDILACNGTLATGNSTESAIEAQFCAAFNRHVMENYADWTVPSAYYQAAPANFYAQFWHNHNVGGLAYGFPYDDGNNESTTISTGTPEHMAFGIGW